MCQASSLPASVSTDMIAPSESNCAYELSRTWSSMPAPRMISIERCRMNAARGWIAVPGWRSTTSDRDPVPAQEHRRRHADEAAAGDQDRDVTVSALIRRNVPRSARSVHTHCTVRRLFLKTVGAVHRSVYRASGGRVAGSIKGVPVLLLTTKGRKTGKRRVTPLLYVADGERIVVVASNGGSDRHPAWWLNICSEPAVEVEIGRRKSAMTARAASPRNARACGRSSPRATPAMRRTPHAPRARSPSSCSRRRADAARPYTCTMQVMAKTTLASELARDWRELGGILEPPAARLARRRRTAHADEAPRARRAGGRGQPTGQRPRGADERRRDDRNASIDRLETAGVAKRRPEHSSDRRATEIVP